MLNISNGVSLVLDAHGRIQADGLKNLPEEKADEIRRRIKDNRDSIVEYLNLWDRAHKLADYVDGDTPYEDRIAERPELNRLIGRMTELELKTKANPPTPGKKTQPENTREYLNFLIRCPVGTKLNQAKQPKHSGSESCPACGQSKWWRKNQPGSKWICGRCHPPATGLDVIYE